LRPPAISIKAKRFALQKITSVGMPEMKSKNQHRDVMAECG